MPEAFANDVCRAIKSGVDYVARNGEPNPGQGDRGHNVNQRREQNTTMEDANQYKQEVKHTQIALTQTVESRPGSHMLTKASMGNG